MAPSQPPCKTKPTTAPQNSTNKDIFKDTTPLSANFAHTTNSLPTTTTQQQQYQHQHQHQQQCPPTIDYDHEVYLQLVADGHKTPNQVYREERDRHRTSRSLDPAIISDPRGVPSSIGFEWAEESQRRTNSRDVSSD